MSDSFEEDPFAPARIRDPRPAAPPSLPLIAQYGLALVFVALATGLAFLVQHLISAPNVTATALHRIFRAPAAILMQCENRFEAVATAGSAQITEADREAARGALSSHENTRGDTYPYVGAYFDFWPISTPAGCNCVLGVDFVHAARERPHSPEQIIEVIAAYVAAAFAPRS